MAASGFEGFEKRIELHFSGSSEAYVLGLRGIDFLRLRAVLDEVQCSVVSAIGNESFDAYVLSESSLFVYHDKIIIKTCGTTQLLRSVPGILSGAGELGMAAVGCSYTRGSFIFPSAQPFPHTSFEQEVEYLERSLPGHLIHKKACVLRPPPMASHSHAWHVFTAMASGYRPDRRRSKSFTMEICMTELDRAHAEKFFRRAGDLFSGEAAGKAMTAATGVGAIHPAAIVCDYAFDPCGYSMNGVVDGDRYSTIHVTPEEGFSYASFECIAPADVGGREEVAEVVKKVASVFRPGCMTVALTVGGAGDEPREMAAGVAAALDVVAMEGGECLVEEFPGAETIAFQSFRVVDRH